MVEVPRGHATASLQQSRRKTLVRLACCYGNCGYKDNVHGSTPNSVKFYTRFTGKVKGFGDVCCLAKTQV